MRWAELSLLQLRRFRRGRMARGAIITIILLPLLYGAVYIYAFWNPYGTMSGLPVALVVADQPTEAQGRQVFLGPQIESELVSGGQLGWHVVSAEEASAGLADNRYYFAVTIPPTFSADVASLGSGSPRHARIIVTNNESANFLTSMISDEAGTRLVDTVSEAVVDEFVATSLAGIQEIRASLEQAAAGAGKLAAGTSRLTAATRQLVSGTRRLSAGAAQVAAGNRELAQMGDEVRGYAEIAEADVGKVINAIAAFVKAHPDDEIAKIALAIAEALEPKVDSVISAVIEATDQIDMLSDGSSQVAEGAAQLASAAPRLHAGSVQLRNGARELAAGLAAGVQQIPAMSPGQVAATASTVSAPIELQTRDENPVATYGTGFAPYFIPLSLWVGGIMAFMLLKPLPARALLSPRMPPLGAAVIGYLPVAVVSIGQVLALALVLHFAVGVEARHSALLLGFLVLTGLSYMAILQMLNAALGTAGRVVALVLLMAQLTSSGGTYPVQMTPAFFQAISPFLPMTYVVRTARLLVGGGNLSLAAAGALMVAVFGALSFVITVLVARSKQRWVISDFKPEVSL